MTKTCKKCQAEKPLADFYDHKGFKSGKETTCKACLKAKRQASYQPKPPRWAPFDPTATTKLCKKCDVTKPFADFHADCKRRDGRYPHCKECHYGYMRHRYYTNPNVKPMRIAAYARRKDDPQFIADAKRRNDEFYGSVEGRAKTLLNGARQRDPNCTLTLDHIKQGIEAGRCPMTGIEFDLTKNHQNISGRSKSTYSPSIDRIDSFKGYTNENVRVVIWQYNMAI